MQLTRRSLLIYGLLLAAWILILAWQVVEHARVKESARVALIDRTKDISSTLGIVLRSQRRFGGVVSKERIESSLSDLVKQGELNGVPLLSGIALLNEAGEIVASAGVPIEPHPHGEAQPAEVWGDQTVTLMNLVALGTNLTQDLEGTNPPIVMSRQDFLRPFETNRPAGPPNGFRPREGDTNAFDRPPPPRDEDDRFRREPRPEGPNLAENSPPPGSTNFGRGRGPGGGRPRFPRPPWMNEAEFKALIQKQGVHSFVIVMGTQSMQAVCRDDLWLRGLIGALATVAVLGYGMAWRNLAKSSDLQIRLVRASELNLHLKEMNLAAAGLAHETRNPLNIIRGLAQMISKQPDAAEQIRKKSREIIDEADRVTAQLNEFINYSRPREVRRSAVALGSVVGEVVRALNYDLEEKHIRLQVPEIPFSIQADEHLLRQALFNLVLNATQVVPPNGEIQVVAGRNGASEAFLEIRDNGPGVPPEQRTEIFKPYVTTQQKGTGLGLAIVQQIVLAHGWEIVCLPNEPRGAVFRLTHLGLVA